MTVANDPGIAQVRHLHQLQLPQVEVRFDPDFGVLWGHMDPRPRATFNTELLGELRRYVDSVTEHGGTIVMNGRQHRIQYAVIASKIDRIFNLGGDLVMFREAIRRNDRRALVAYGEQCIDNLYPWSRNCDLPLTTVSLVQGDALGGGFECALASSVLIAEESARMGFPEILFNLFPGMGGYSFLLRRVGRRLTEELIASGNVYSARQLYDMGIVDELTPDGTGEAAVYAFVRKHSKAGNGRRAVERVRHEVDPVTRDELMRIVHVWADAALRLTERDLRMMDRLVRAQGRERTDPDQDLPAAPTRITQLQRVV